MDDKVTASDACEDERFFSEDIGELCTIDDDVPLIDLVRHPEELSELIVIKDDDSCSLGEEEDIMECSDPIGIDPADTDPYAQVTIKNEDSESETVENEDPESENVENENPESETVEDEDASTENPSKTPRKESQRRTRYSCSKKQLLALERTFKQTRYPDTVLKHDLGARLGLTYDYVRNWFKCQRARAKRMRTRRLEESRRYESRIPTKTAGTGKKCNVSATKPDAKKTSRTLLSAEQREVLEGVFMQVATPDTNTLEYLAEDLNLTPSRVKDWFRHKRNNLKNKTDSTTQPLRPSRGSKSQFPTQTGAEGSCRILPQAGGSGSSSKVEEQSLPKLQRYVEGSSKELVNDGAISKNSPGLQSSSFTCTNLEQTEAGSRAMCQVCGLTRPKKKFSDSVCYACDSFMKRYKSLSQTKRRLAVPPCSHDGSEVLAGCKGCRLYLYERVVMKQNTTSPLKIAQNQPAVRNIKTASPAAEEYTPVLQDTNQRRRSNRLLAGSNCQLRREEQKDDGNAVSGVGLSDLKASAISHAHHSMDLQKTIHVTGKLNKLRRIAATLSNPDHMETKDRLTLSDELDSCVDDLFSLVLGINPPASKPKADQTFKTKSNESPKTMANDSSKTKANESSTEQPCSADPQLPNPTTSVNETSRSSLERKIQSLEDVVKESVTRIRGLEGQIQNPVRKETSTQTDAYLLFSFVNQPENRDISLTDRQSYYRNHSDSIHSVLPSILTQNSSSMPTSHCRVCDKTRPQADMGHNFICTLCHKFMEDLKILYGPKSLFAPHCNHSGTQVAFGCKGCLLYRYNMVTSGLMPNAAQVELSRSQPKGMFEKNNGCHVPPSMRRIPETHQPTLPLSSHFTQHLIPSYQPPYQPPPSYPQTGNAQSAISATTQLSFTLGSQGATTSEANLHQRVSPIEVVPEAPLVEKNKKCRTTYGHNYQRMWCEGCRHKKACTRFG